MLRYATLAATFHTRIVATLSAIAARACYCLHKVNGHVATNVASLLSLRTTRTAAADTPPTRQRIIWRHISPPCHDDMKASPCLFAAARRAIAFAPRRLQYFDDYRPVLMTYVAAWRAKDTALCRVEEET